MTTEDPKTEIEVPGSGTPAPKPDARRRTLTRISGVIVALAAVGTVLAGLTGYWTTYRTVTRELLAPGKPGPTAPTEAAHLSIVVLPFANLSGDPSQDYFADGITENLTTDLSRIRNSFVIARNTAFTFKGKNMPVKEVSKELGVRYVLEGSVQRDQNRVRVNAQLIDGETGAHLWADRFEESITDLFKLQDQVVARLANSLRVELVNAESQRPRPQKPDAVDLTMRGWSLLWQKATRESDRATRDLLEQAIKLDPTDADAYAGVAYSHALDFINGWTEPGADYNALVMDTANRALAIDPRNGMAAFVKGYYLFLIGRLDESIAAAEAARQRNPNLAPLYLLLCFVRTARGEYDQAKTEIEQAMRLSPRDPRLGAWEYALGVAELGLGHYTVAIDDERRAIVDDFNTFWPHGVLAAAFALSDHNIDAATELAEAMRLSPKFATVKSLPPAARQVPRLVEGLRKAGLPEE